jgi:hypothetical protein
MEDVLDDERGAGDIGEHRADHEAGDQGVAHELAIPQEQRE